MSHPKAAPKTFLELSSDVASYYGFTALPPAGRGRAHTFSTALNASSTMLGKSGGEPVLSWWANTSPLYLPPGITDSAEFSLSVVGSEESVGEIVILKTITAIMREWEAPVAKVRVNALGDRDSKLRFARELSGYLRKHAMELEVECREMLDDPMKALVCQTLVSREVLEAGPRAMNFLSEKSRAHFREVLEHLEHLGLPYEIDDLLVGDERDPRIMFALDLEEPDATVTAAWGGRYDDYVRRVTGERTAATASASIFFRKKGLPARTGVNAHSKVRAPKLYFVQLGTRAKLEGLAVLDILRAARIPVLQSFDAARLGPQLEAAKKSGVSHLMILGAREVLDRTVIVRAMDNSSQEIVPLQDLPRFMRGLKA
jgi:histidyl-tRNA synthetase